ncbi:MAG TPA: hypothetical protein VIZ65_05125 [Cellvibrionaceae bacterium]
MLLLQDQGRLIKPAEHQPAFDDEFAPISLGYYTRDATPQELDKSEIQAQLQHLKVPAEIIGQAFTRLNNWQEGRFVSDSWLSLQQFLMQLESAGLTEEELHILAQARLKLAGSCPDSKFEPIEAGLISTTVQEFALYLKAAAAFYAGNFNEAVEGFKSLSQIKTAWVGQIALCMMGRVYLNLAQQGATDSWGLFAKDAINTAQLTNASLAFNAYLTLYPQGIYAASAKGLARKITWLGQNQADLIAVYGSTHY